MTSVPKNSDFSRHFPFYSNIVENACEITLQKSNQIVQWINKTNYHFNNTRMLMSAFFKDFFNKISRFKKAFYNSAIQ